MSNKVIFIITLILSLLLISTSYAEAASSATRHRKHHRYHPRAVAHHHSHHSHHANKSKTQKKLAVENDNRWDVNPKVWTLALKAYKNALQKGYIKQKIVTIIDYSLPSSVKRMWVVDVNKQKVLYHTLVAHGKHTGGLFAKHFSDRPGSRASSIGTFVTENTYFGSNGYSLKLRGLEPGFNDRAKSRAIVMHGAWYVTQDFAKHHGRLGQSWGCPAVSPKLAKPIINNIKNGSLVFAYYPDNKWLHKSHFLATG